VKEMKRTKEENDKMIKELIANRKVLLPPKKRYVPKSRWGKCIRK